MVMFGLNGCKIRYELNFSLTTGKLMDRHPGPGIYVGSVNAKINCLFYKAYPAPFSLALLPSFTLLINF
jgi:hypothetical protein